MVIYGEYLFLENFTVGIILLGLTGKLAGYKSQPARLLAGAAFCGLGGFIIFMPLQGALSALVRIGTGFLCTGSAFGFREIFKTTGIFMVLTFLSGGAVMALLLWQQQPAVSHQGIIYMDGVTYFKLLATGILAFGIAYWFVKLVRARNADINMKGKVCLIIDGKNYQFRAFVDSGNCLREPLTGKPVILIDEAGAAKLPFAASDMPARYRIIPYKAVGTASGSLEGLRTDRVIFENHRVEGAYVAFYRGNFGDFEVLMNKEFLEGGLLQDV